MASSRVGAMTSASGSPAGASRSASPRISGAQARPKATVFPDPVWAETIKSRPAASGSSTACWTDVKDVYPRAASASPSEYGRLVKDIKYQTGNGNRKSIGEGKGGAGGVNYG